VRCACVCVVLQKNSTFLSVSRGVDLIFFGYCLLRVLRSILWFRSEVYTSVVSAITKSNIHSFRRRHFGFVLVYVACVCLKSRDPLLSSLLSASATMSSNSTACGACQESLPEYAAQLPRCDDCRHFFHYGCSIKESTWQSYRHNGKIYRCSSCRGKLIANASAAGASTASQATSTASQASQSKAQSCGSSIATQTPNQRPPPSGSGKPPVPLNRDGAGDNSNKPLHSGAGLPAPGVQTMHATQAAPPCMTATYACPTPTPNYAIPSCGTLATSTQNGQQSGLEKNLADISRITSDLAMQNINTDDLKSIALSLAQATANLAQSVSFISDRYDKLLDAQARQAAEISQLRDENNSLTTKYEELLQYSYKENVEIKGIPVTAQEDCAEIVKRIGASLNVALCDADISVAHRTYSDGKSGPPTIVARLVRRIKRTELISACRRQKPLLATLGYNSQEPFYVSDHMTRNSKRLMSEATRLRKEKHWKFLWTSDCKILMRKNEHSKILRIASDADLPKIV
jgi:hypothetical protein